MNESHMEAFPTDGSFPHPHATADRAYSNMMATSQNLLQSADAKINQSLIVSGKMVI